jgi:hypothetical protein
MWSSGRCLWVCGLWISVLQNTSGKICIVATYKKHPAETSNKIPTQNINDFEFYTSIADNEKKAKQADIGFATVNHYINHQHDIIFTRRYLANSQSYRPSWNRKVPNPKAAGALWSRIAKNIIIPKLPLDSV